MKLQTSVAALAGLTGLVSHASAGVVALPRDPSPEEAAALALAPALHKRGSPDAPNGYTPSRVDCPSSRPQLRNALALSQEETSWLKSRRNATIPAMRDLLGRLSITGFDSNSYFNNHASNDSALPNIAVAVSGGGYRAMLNGAGAVAAYDSRTENSTAKGHLGGLLQSSTYLAGLSGGGWLVGSLYTNNFTSVQAIINTSPEYSGSLWQLENSIFEGPDTGGFQILDTAQYYNNLYDSVQAKGDAGFDTTLTDYWGRALSFQLVNASNGGPAYTFSSIQDDTTFKQGNAPMPILVADERNPGQTIISSNATNFEFTPWEMGSYDPTVFGFVPLRYIGSNFSAGSLPNNESCIRGFDNAAFVMGTSSSLFNQFLLQINSTSGVPDVLKSVLTSVLEKVGQNEEDIASWEPNPFFGWNNATNPNAADKQLTLVDGGEDLQNIPLTPLVQPLRNVDVIFAVDSSADTSDPGANWPNGTALVATYERSLNASQANGTIFPSIPDQNTFVNLGLNNKPTMFGCDAGNFSSSTPIVVYVPNSPYVFNSNISTFTDSYTVAQRNAMVENGYNVATMGNGTVDADWPACVGCAIMSRSWNRTNTAVPEVCTQCFDRYCWNGTRASNTPATPYQPQMRLQAINVKSAGFKRAHVPAAAAVIGAVGVTGALLL
ncbi:lysophospholipase catalytic domain-containing protein [Phyllosticta citricarpa]|uniref:Lysophospholipase n=1 Tax=Phyllosticta paracitricarpa TaxID=2016321 RepID=A0ABR1N3Q6_9PEZI